ncbi:AIR synthase [cyanobiont of Ornithocercus magnificus]|nr:AIR synthase [cyanobiont of Ornithocercus magnificus]
MQFQLTQTAAAELLRLSLVAETQGNCYIDLLTGAYDNGMMHIRIRPGCYGGEPIYRSNGITLYAPTDQLKLLNSLTLSYIDNIGGGGFLITVPPGAELCSCGSGFRTSLPES